MIQEPEIHIQPLNSAYFTRFSNKNNNLIHCFLVPKGVRVTTFGPLLCHHGEGRSVFVSNLEVLLWSNQLSSLLMIVAR